MHIPTTGHQEKEGDQLFFYRQVLIEKGEIDLQLLFQPRFDYARLDPALTKVAGGVLARADRWKMALTTGLELDIDEKEVKGAWQLSAGDEAWFKLASHSGREQEGSFSRDEDLHCPARDECRQALEETRKFWHTWLASSETGRSISLHSFGEMVERSALVLKLLYYDPASTIAAAAKLSDYVGKIDIKLWPALRAICDYVIEHWQEPDSGIWEVRGGPYHFVYSKVMCWVALDRGLIIAERYGFPADLERWREVREKIRQEVLDKGYCREKKAFVQHYDTTDLDASNLLLPLLGFLPFDDPRIITTIEAIRDSLSNNGLLYRYRAPDGIEGEDGTFLLCSFWLVDCLVGLGRLREAEHLLRRLERTANHLGLFAEEYDVRWQEPLGNFPQAFTHIGYINSVIRLLKAQEKEGKKSGEEKKSLGLMDSLARKLLAPKYVLNDGEPEEDTASRDIATELKTTMNLLRGAFFEQQRVAYEQMKQAEL